MSDVLSYCREQWGASAGRLAIGDIDIEDVVDIVGGTPTFAYDRGRVSSVIGDVRSAFPGVDLFYSIKANPFSPLLSLIANLVDGFDVASSGELLRAICAGKSGSSIQFSGPAKQRGEMLRGIAAGAILNVESPGQVAEAAAAALDAETSPRLVLRVNPHMVLGASGLRMGGAGSQFGIDPDRIKDAVDLCRRNGVEPLGFHFYWGTQCLDGEKLAAAQRECWRMASELSDSNKIDLKYLNLGGGFGIPYYKGDEVLDITPVAGAIKEIGDALSERQPEARLVVELGRYLVGPAGLYIVRVVDVKTSGGVKIAVTDGGMHQHLAASGNLGQGLRRSFPCYTATRMNEPPVEQVRVVGSLCTPIDILCPDANLPAIAAGDLIAIFQSGAYAATASPQAFLSRPPISEILL